MWGLVAAAVWWAGLFVAYHVADVKGRGPWRWTLAAAFLPVWAPLLVWLLPDRSGYVADRDADSFS